MIVREGIGGASPRRDPAHDRLEMARAEAELPTRTGVCRGSEGELTETAEGTLLASFARHPKEQCWRLSPQAHNPRGQGANRDQPLAGRELTLTPLLAERGPVRPDVLVVAALAVWPGVF